MWKLLVGFIVFAAVALLALKMAGDKVDMGGEKHEVTGAAESASMPASAASQ